MTAGTITTRSAEATMAAGSSLGALVQPGDVIVLTGDLGAGKTQLTKGVGTGLGVGEPVTSPTFNILLVHEGRIPLYHFDLYRLDDAEQLVDIDYFATLEADGVSLVEWGDRFPSAAPLDGLAVSLLIEGDTERRIEITALGDRGEELLGEWVEACAALDGVDVGGLT